MRFGELIESVSWEDVKLCFIHSYGQHYQKYKKRIRKKKLSRFETAFYELLRMEESKTKWRLVLYKTIKEGVEYVDVSGLDGSLYKDYEYFDPDKQSECANHEMPYGLGFTSWSEWKGMAVEAETFDSFSHNEIVAHCLWELTFYGFSNVK